MRAKDVADCVKVIATHPVIGPRYGSAIAELRTAWLRVLNSGRWNHAAAMIEQVEGSRTTICFVGMAVFVSDDFVREIKTPPLRWFGPELAKRILGGNSPLLSDQKIREANTCGGLTTIAWEGCIHPAFERHSEVHRMFLGAFIELHRGYLWKEAISSQIESVERFRWVLQTGGMLWDPKIGRYVESPEPEKDPREIIREPHILGVTRDLERRRPGSWVGALFDYHPPRFAFRQAEQRLLLSALPGRTDRELCDDLGISPSTVKNTWRSIYDRVDPCLPKLLLNSSEKDEGKPERGREKRRYVLAYLREHPEELRPVLRRRLA